MKETPEIKNIPTEIFISEITAKQLIERLDTQQSHYILKSKYDELLKEKEGLEDKLENCEILKSACEKANAEMQGTRSATYHQLCPKCNGQGIVQKPPHVAGDVNEWISSNTIYTCDVCNGNKTLIMPIEIKPTEK